MALHDIFLQFQRIIKEHPWDLHVVCPRLCVVVDGHLSLLLSLLVPGVVEIGRLEVHAVIVLCFFYCLEQSQCSLVVANSQILKFKQLYTVMKFNISQNTFKVLARFLVKIYPFPLSRSLIELVEEITSSTFLVQPLSFILSHHTES